MRELIERRRRYLIDRLPDRSAPRKQSLSLRLTKIPMERDRWRRRTAAAFGLIAVLVVAVGVFAISAGGLLEAKQALVPLDDVRFETPLDTHSITGWTFADENKVVLSTKGGGVVVCRVDGHPFGICRTIEPVTADGNPLGLSFESVVDAQDRFWFVGSDGSLSSCARGFDDWQVHMGSRGFVPGLDLGTQLTDLVDDTQQNLLIFGTKQDGVAIYDRNTREWYSTGALPSKRITALVLLDRTLFVGTDAGLASFTIERTGDTVRISQNQAYRLPDELSPLPVKRLKPAKGGTAEASSIARLDGIFEGGIHAVLDLATQRWRVVTPAADRDLEILNRPAALSHIARTGGKETGIDETVWFGLPGFGIAAYSPAQRSLTRRHRGVEDVGLKQDDIEVCSLHASRIEKKDLLWAVVDRDDRDGVCKGEVLVRLIGPRFSHWDIDDSRLIIETIRNSKSKKGNRLLSILPPKEQNDFREATSDKADPETAEAALLELLDRLTTHPVLWEETLYAKRRIRKKVRKWAKTKKQLTPEIGRRLLQEVFPSAIRKTDTWVLITKGNADAVEAVGQRERVAVRFDDGRVRFFTAPTDEDINTADLFEPARFGKLTGPVTVGRNQLFAAVGEAPTSNETVARYVSGWRGWQNLKSDNKTPFAALRQVGNSLFGIKQNGEAGRFKNLGAPHPVYSPIFGTSVLETVAPGPVIAAEAFAGKTWFVRLSGKTNKDLYVYTPKSRVIDRVDGPVSAAMKIPRLRATKDNLYLFDADDGTSLHLLAGNRFVPASTNGQSFKQLAVGPSGVLGLTPKGEIFLMKDGKWVHWAFENKGQTTWRRLMVLEGSGDLVGIDGSNKVGYYRRATGSWSKVDLDYAARVNDMVLEGENAAATSILFGTNNGVQSKYVVDGEWRDRIPESTAKEEQQYDIANPFMMGHQVEAVAYHADGERVFIDDGDAGSVMHRSPGQSGWKSVLATDNTRAPEGQKAREAAWTGVVDGALWIMSDGGGMWRYEPDRHVWSSFLYETGLNRHSTAPEDPYLDDEGVLWWRSDNSLSAARILPGDEFETWQFPGTPKYRMPVREAVAAFARIAWKVVLGIFGTYLAILLAWLLVLFFVRIIWPPLMLLIEWSVIFPARLLYAAIRRLAIQIYRLWGRRVHYPILGNLSLRWRRIIRRIPGIRGRFSPDGVAARRRHFEERVRDWSAHSVTVWVDDHFLHGHLPYFDGETFWDGLLGSGLGFVGAPLNIAIGFASTALLTGLFFGMDAGVNAWLERDRPFVELDMKGRVSAYAFDDDTLKIQTEKGVYRFDAGFEHVSPDGFEAGAKLTDDERPAAPVYPQRVGDGLEVRRAEKQIEVWRKGATGKWHHCPFAHKGLSTDQLSGAALLSNVSVVRTPAGMYEIPSDKSVEVAFWPMEIPADARLHVLRDTAYLCTQGDHAACRKRTGPGEWIPLSSPPAPREMKVAGIEWTDGLFKDILKEETSTEEKQFVENRFVWDTAETVAVDKAGRLRIKTSAGWRTVAKKEQHVVLAPPTPTVEPAPKAKTWRVSDRWECTREDGTTEEDKKDEDDVFFSFIPKPGPATADPFGEAGRFPDETAVALDSADDKAWIGTAAGLHIYDSDGAAESFTRPGEAIRAFALNDGLRAYRSSRGDYLFKDEKWVKSGSSLTERFNARRTHLLSLGPALAVGVTEHRGTNTAHHPDLPGLDIETGRFDNDIITGGISAVGDDLWIATKAGVQQIAFSKWWSTTERVELADRQSRRLTMDPFVEQLYLVTENDETWVLSDNEWRFAEAGTRDTPFNSPLSGTITDAISWAGCLTCDDNRNRFTLFSSNGLLRFVDGKLSTDYIDDVQAGPTAVWQSTRAGVLRLDDSGAAVPVPHPPGRQFGIPTRVAFDRKWEPTDETIFARTETGTYRLNDAVSSAYPPWKETDTETFDALHLHSDGETWTQERTPGRPRVTFGPTGQERSTLSDSGRFPFDHVKSVAGTDDHIWLAHLQGVRTLNRASNRPFWVASSKVGEPMPIALRTDEQARVWLKAEDRPVGAETKTVGISLVSDPGESAGGVDAWRLPESLEQSPFSAIHDWRPTGSEGARVRIADDNRRVAYQTAGILPVHLSFEANEKALDIQTVGKSAWVLAEKHLYRVNPHAETSDADSAWHGRDETVYWAPYLAKSPFDADAWCGMGDTMASLGRQAMSDRLTAVCRLLKSKANWRDSYAPSARQSVYSSDTCFGPDPTGAATALFERIGITSPVYFGALAERALEVGCGRTAFDISRHALRYTPNDPSLIDTLLRSGLGLLSSAPDDLDLWRRMGCMFETYGAGSPELAQGIEHYVEIIASIENKKDEISVISDDDIRSALTAVGKIGLNTSRWLVDLATRAVAAHQEEMAWNLIEMAMADASRVPDISDWAYQMVRESHRTASRWSRLAKLLGAQGHHKIAGEARAVASLLKGGESKMCIPVSSLIRTIGIRNGTWIIKLAKASHEAGCHDAAWSLLQMALSRGHKREEARKVGLPLARKLAQGRLTGAPFWAELARLYEDLEMSEEATMCRAIQYTVRTGQTTPPDVDPTPLLREFDIRDTGWLNALIANSTNQYRLSTSLKNYAAELSGE